MSQDNFIYLRWKTVWSVATAQTHRDMFTAFVQVSEELFSTPDAGRSYGWSWAHRVCQVGSALPHVPLLIVNHLPSLRVDFFVCLSQKSIMAGLPCLFPPQHPSLPRSCLLSFLVHHQWATGLEICWLEGHWFKFRVCWYDQEGKMPLWQIILSKWTFHLLSSVGCINAQLQKEILLALVQKWEPVLVGFRWRLVFCSHELIKVLTIKQVFLQFR